MLHSHSGTELFCCCYGDNLIVRVIFYGLGRIRTKLLHYEELLEELCPLLEVSGFP